MVPFVGPSYQLNTRSADVQRSINMRPVPVESGTGASGFMLQSNPGMRVFSSSLSGLGRSVYATRDRVFAVVGDALFEVSAGGVMTSCGTLNTSAGQVSMDSNTTQLFLADGSNGYVFNLYDRTFKRSLAAAAIGGSVRTAYLDQYAIWAPPGASTFYISALGDADDSSSGHRLGGEIGVRPRDRAARSPHEWRDERNVPR